MLRPLSTVLLLVPITACQPLPSNPSRTGDQPAPPALIIAHRGASGERPEHTIAAYRLAIEQGADFIEPDLVPTADGVLIARHENELSDSTDIAERPEFAGRRSRRSIDGTWREGWFSEDFTLAEIKSLRARERLPALRPHSAAYDGHYEVATLAEILALLHEAASQGRRVGVYPEIKHPTHFAHEARHPDGQPLQLDLARILIETLVAEGFVERERVYIQCFELLPLIRLRRELLPAHGLDLPLILLLGDLERQPPLPEFAQPYDIVYHARRNDDLRALYGDFVDRIPAGLGRDTGYADLAEPAVMAWLAQHIIDGIGPWKNALLPRLTIEPAPQDPQAPRHRLTGAVHPLAATARELGLAMHPFTLRAEAPFLAIDEHGRAMSMTDEMQRLLDLGATGFFTDHPALARAALAGW